MRVSELEKLIQKYGEQQNLLRLRMNLKKWAILVTSK